MNIATITPLDTTFFRDGRAFTMGEDSDTLSTVFPPAPSVIYGALRTHYFSSNIAKLSQANTDTDPTKDLVIHDIYITIKGIPHYPMPLDTYMDDKYLKLLQRIPINKCHKPTHTDFILQTDKTVKRTDGQYYFSALDDYRNPSNFDALNHEAINIYDKLTSEEEIGIGRKNKQTEQGKLFRIPFTRWETVKNKVNMFTFEQVKLVVVYDELHISSGTLKLGGESKMAIIDIETNNCSNSHQLTVANGECYKLYFRTPAIFAEGALPKKLFCDNLGVKITAAAVGKPLFIGGWDIKANTPKPTEQAVPPGTVYDVQVHCVEKFIAFLNANPYSLRINNDVAYTKQGYGRFECIKVNCNQ